MNRTINATPPPAGPALRVVSVDGTEALSELFEYRVGFKSVSPDIDCQKMIGEACVFTPFGLARLRRLRLPKMGYVKSQPWRLGCERRTDD
jgi:hypothetical protein